MYIEKGTLVKLLSGVSGMVAVIIFLVLVIGKNAPVVQKHSPVLPKESKNSITVSPSNQPAVKKENLDRVQSRLSKKIKALESAISELKKNQRSVARSDFSRNPEQDHTQETPKTPEMEEEEIKAQIQAQLYMMEEYLQFEPVDKEWSDSAITALYESVQNKSDSLSILNTDFRSTFCRVDLAVDINTDVQESFGELQDIIPWDGEMFFQVDDINSGTAVVYVAREGYSLPQSDENESVSIVQ